MRKPHLAEDEQPAVKTAPTAQKSDVRNWHQRLFFGLHYDLHAGAGDTELGAALTHEHLREALLRVKPDWVQCDCKGHPGYTSWPTKVGSTSPGVVRDALRIHRDVTRELGIPLVMHYSGVWDIRAVELHPEWARIGSAAEGEGKEDFIKGTTCNLSSYTDELMVPQMLELIEKYDVDGFWVDGENWATRACYCSRCTGEFTARTGITDIPQLPTDPGWAAWADFHRTIFEEHVQKYTAAVHARKPGCLVCSNWMYTVSHPSNICVPVDYLSGDFTWKWGVYDALLEGRFMESRGLSWNLMAWGFSSSETEMSGWTFKPAAHLCQEAAVVIALGGNIQIYNQPQRSGHLTNWQQEIMADVARFVRARQPWCQYSKSVQQVAILHAASHYYKQNGVVLMAKSGQGHIPLVGALHALLENHCQVDVLGESDLCERMSAYSLIVLPEQTNLNDELKTALADYVRNGGKVILSGTHIAADFAELTGTVSDGDIQDGYFYLPVGRESTIVKGPWQPVKLRGARNLYSLMLQQEPGYNATDSPAVTLNCVGEGLVLAIHSAFFMHYGMTHYPRTRALVGEFIAALAPEFLVSIDAPARLQLSLRRQPGHLIVHLLNLGSGHPTTPQQTMIEEVPPVGPISLRIVAAKEPTRIYLAPGMEQLSWNFRAGILTVQIVSVGILDSVVIED